MKICQHPNIVRMVDLYETADNYFIVLEYMAGKDLFEYFSARNFHLTEDRIIEIVY